MTKQEISLLSEEIWMDEVKHSGKKLRKFVEMAFHLVFSAAAVILIVLGALTLAGMMGFMTP